MNELPRPEINVRTKAEACWDRGEFLEAGRILFEGLPEEQRPLWAAAILEFAVPRMDVPMCGVRFLQHVVAARRRWRSGHAAFDKIRYRTLRLEDRKKRTPIQERMLSQCYLAENVARVIYNSTGPIDPFDEDSGWWVIPCLKDCVDRVGDPEFEAQARLLLFGKTAAPCDDKPTLPKAL